jgi:hypothetical protein
MRAVLFLLCGTLAAQYPPAPPQDTSGFGAGVQRTMTLLAASTPRKRNTVRILFYGQSITKQDWQDRHSFQWMRDLAQKYGLEWGDVRRPWREYLEMHKLPPQALLRDSVHLNAHGDWLMAELIKRHLRHIPGVPADAWRDLVQVYTPGKDAAWAGNRLELEFEGNRVEAVAERGWRRPGTRARFLIDGKAPSELPELRVHGKMTDTWGPDWPVAIRVSARSPLLLEDWTLTIFEAGPNGKRFRFRVEGSRTGPDGEGLSAERFVSKSGRVLIESEDWHVARARDLRKESINKLIIEDL